MTTTPSSRHGLALACLALSVSACANWPKSQHPPTVTPAPIVHRQVEVIERTRVAPPPPALTRPLPMPPLPAPATNGDLYLHYLACQTGLTEAWIRLWELNSLAPAPGAPESD